MESPSPVTLQCCLNNAEREIARKKTEQTKRDEKTRNEKNATDTAHDDGYDIAFPSERERDHTAGQIHTNKRGFFFFTFLLYVSSP
jgi:hypothetical protein